MPKSCPHPAVTLFLALFAVLATGHPALAQGAPWWAGIDPVAFPPALDVALAPASGSHLAFLRLPPLEPVPALDAAGVGALKPPGSHQFPAFPRDARPRPSPLVPLYVSFATLQTLDAVTTVRALDRGAEEVNPVLGGIAGNKGALLAAKAGVTVGTVYLAERLWKRNRTAAVVLMAALNGAYASIVAHNHRVGR